ncbi:MAG: helicase-related protein, partial [Gemmatimonadales bacterium]
MTFRRVLAAVERYGGALLADPVGTGKTYVALAAAAATNGPRPTVCLVPAALQDQWRQAARRTGVPIVPWSHERASRGSLPPHAGRLAIIDESHRLRNPATRGYGHVAGWLLGRRTLLLSATPVVNRLADLAHQLRLAVRDDALAPHGLASLGTLLNAGRGHPALGLVVLATAASSAHRPRAVERAEQVPPTVGDDLEARLHGIDRLALSPEPQVAALVRCVLWRAAASSPAALVASLRRYRRLLLHARDAADAGKRPDRRALVRLTGGLTDQLLMWELLPGSGDAADLVVDDLPMLESLIARAAADTACDDMKLTRLRALLADGRTTLVFTVARETVRWLRDQLGPRIAWCTGERAGIGAMRTSRRSAFEWFRAEAAERRKSPAERCFAPEHLVTTDVAAEGLDLQGAERVVHYDLPWTPMRLDQRRGRVVRAGSLHSEVELVRFDLPAALERRLGHVELLARKARLPAIVGLDEGGDRWRWRSELAAAFEGFGAERGVAAVAAEPAGMLAGFTLHAWPDAGRAPVAAHVLWWDERSGWTEDPDTLLPRLDLACRAPPVSVPALAVRVALERIGAAVRE